MTEPTKKPWDALRGEAVKPPMKPGTWLTNTALIVTWDYSAYNVRVSVAGHDIGGTRLVVGTIRELGEFLIELAEQIEPTKQEAQA